MKRKVSKDGKRQTRKKIKQRRRKQRKMSETPGLKSHLRLMLPHPPAEGNTVVFLQFAKRNKPHSQRRSSGIKRFVVVWQVTATPEILKVARPGTKLDPD